MKRRTVMVLHREPLVAEAIASALDRFAWLAPIAIGRHVQDALHVRVDAVVLDAELEGAEDAAVALRRRGRQVVILAATEGASSVRTDRPVEVLAHRLAPGMETTSTTAAQLSTREREVLKLIAKGLAGKQVASLLGISPKTVEQHKTRIYGKLGVANQAEAVAVAGRSCEGVAWVSPTT